MKIVYGISLLGLLSINSALALDTETLMPGDSIVLIGNKIVVLARYQRPVIYSDQLDKLYEFDNSGIEIVQNSKEMYFYNNFKMFDENRNSYIELKFPKSYGKICFVNNMYYHFVIEEVYNSKNSMMPDHKQLYYFTNKNQSSMKLIKRQEVGEIFCGKQEIFAIMRNNEREMLFKLENKQWSKVQNLPLGQQDKVFMLDRLVVQKNGEVKDLNGKKIWTFGKNCTLLKKQNNILACAMGTDLKVVNLSTGKQWKRVFKGGIVGIALGKFLVVQSSELHLLSFQGKILKSAAYEKR